MSAAALAKDFRVVGWPPDPVDGLGFGPGHPYTELVWLPRLGPTSFLMWRYLCRRLHAQPRGCIVTVDDLAHALGLGTGRGHASPVRRAIARLERFGVTSTAAHGVAVRRRLPLLAPAQLAQLPPPARQAHRSLAHGDTRRAG